MQANCDFRIHRILMNTGGHAGFMRKLIILDVNRKGGCESACVKIEYQVKVQ